MGGVVFAEKKVAAGETISYVIAMGYGDSAEELTAAANKFLSVKAFDKAWDETIAYWQEKVNALLPHRQQGFRPVDEVGKLPANAASDLWMFVPSTS